MQNSSVFILAINYNNLKLYKIYINISKKKKRINLNQKKKHKKKFPLFFGLKTKGKVM